MLWDEKFNSFVSNKDHRSLIILSEEIDRGGLFTPFHYGKYILSLRDLGLKEKAQQVTDEAVMAFPDDRGLRICHAENAMSGHDWEVAILRWQYILNNFQAYPQGVLWRLANAYLKALKFSRARRVVEDIFLSHGDSQKLRDLVSLIDSEESKRYFLAINNLDSSVRYNLESLKGQEKFGRIKYFSEYRVRGWVKVCKGESFKLLVKNHKGETYCYDLNRDRGDVCRHFEKRGDADVETRCGFDHVVDISQGASIGFLVNGSEEWVVSFDLLGVLSVLEGRDGWLFLDNDANKSVAQFTGKVSLSGDMLSAWREYAEDLKYYCAERGLIYFIANSKESVVTEFYPFKRGDETVCDEVESIFLNKGVSYLNPKAVLSCEDGAYYKTDTHWSDYGGYLGYLSVMEKCGFRETVTGVEFEGVEVTGDLGSKVSQERRSLKKIHRYQGPKAECVFRNGVKATGCMEVWENCRAIYSKTVVLFGGSSLRSGSFCSYFFYTFSRVVVVNLPGSLVDDVICFESPDFVVVQTNERYLLKAGKVYRDCESSPIFSKLSTLPHNEKEKVLEEASKYHGEDFYMEKTINMLNLSGVVVRNEIK